MYEAGLGLGLGLILTLTLMLYKDVSEIIFRLRLNVKATCYSPLGLNPYTSPSFCFTWVVAKSDEIARQYTIRLAKQRTGAILGPA